MNPDNTIEQTDSRRENGEAARDRRGDFGEHDTFAFAQGLPEWSVEPPQVTIRRRRRL